ncbi:MAG: hypothetical protein LQ343_007704 [Gyalolechia ehrenbergii]|nr:MAG: hypothetical protein LQ343_007704 [Gyalolechia ehrenbergii]
MIELCEEPSEEAELYIRREWIRDEFERTRNTHGDRSVAKSLGEEHLYDTGLPTKDGKVASEEGHCRAFMSTRSPDAVVEDVRPEETSDSQGKEKTAEDWSPDVDFERLEDFFGEDSSDKMSDNAIAAGSSEAEHDTNYRRDALDTCECDVCGGIESEEYDKGDRFDVLWKDEATTRTDPTVVSEGYKALSSNMPNDGSAVETTAASPTIMDDEGKTDHGRSLSKPKEKTLVATLTIPARYKEWSFKLDNAGGECR